MSLPNDFSPIRVRHIQEMYHANTPIAVLTAYDHALALLLDQAGIDMVLVGDSAANVVGGHATTLPITLEEMIYHARCVCKAIQRALVVVDLPFGSYANEQEGVRTAIRVMKETPAQAIKLEGGSEMAETIRSITQLGIPVMGHVGLTPQSVHQLSGYGVRGKQKNEAEQIKQSTLDLEQAGCFSIVLEKVPSALAQNITEQLHIPTIGIGAGTQVSGQVLVLHDMLGITQNFNPKFLKRYAELGHTITQAVKTYIQEVRNAQFPNDTHAY